MPRPTCDESTMKLYYAPGTIAVASAITLFEAGLPFDPVRLDFTSAEQTGPDYARINPKARVPALVTDNGILTENGYTPATHNSGT